MEGSLSLGLGFLYCFVFFDSMRVILTSFFLFVSVLLSAQTKALKEANSLLKANKISDAEKAIDAILTDSASKDLPEAWNLAGQIQRRIHETENQKAYLHKKYDTLLLYNSSLRMAKYFMKCDDLAQIPDSKGKIKNKFRKANSQYVYEERSNLINGGYYYMALEKEADRRKAIDFFDTYIESGLHPILESYYTAAKDTLIPNVAYFACLTALKVNDYELVSKYASYALNSNEYAQYAMELISTAFLQQGDSIKFLESLKEGIQKYPEDRFFFANIVDFYLKKDRIEEAMAVTNEVLSQNPNNAYNLYVKGYLFQNQEKYDEAIDTYNQAISIDSVYAEAYSGIGLVYCIKAQDYSTQASTDINSSEYQKDQETLRSFYMKAKDAYEKARQLRPDQKELWLNGLYRVYYNLNMGEEFNEIESLLN